MCIRPVEEEESGYCRPISRVLSSVATRTVIPLGVRSPALSSSLPAASLSGWATPRCLFGLAPAGVYRATTVTSRAVSSYLAVSPLPVYRKSVPSAVYFLLHYPSVPFGTAQALSGSVPSGARTFLEHFRARDHPADSIQMEDNRVLGEFASARRNMSV